jgi:hypothetical protein
MAERAKAATTLTATGCAFKAPIGERGPQHTDIRSIRWYLRSSQLPLPWRNASAATSADDPGEPATRSPITGIAGCYACAASGSTPGISKAVPIVGHRYQGYVGLSNGLSSPVNHAGIRRPLDASVPRKGHAGSLRFSRLGTIFWFVR